MEPIFASEHEVDVWQVSWTELMYTHLSQSFDVNLQHREEQKMVVSVDRDQLPLLARRLPPSGFFFSVEILKSHRKTGFTGYHRFILISNKIFRYSHNLLKFNFL
jgi:hypothetical protein